eukprot:5425294-Pyramimonas_sp.AAC.1
MGGKALKARTGKLKNRLRRLRALRAAGAGAKQIWNTDLQQAGSFGMDILVVHGSGTAGCAKSVPEGRGAQ